MATQELRSKIWPLYSLRDLDFL